MFYVFKNMKINGIKFQVKKLEKKKSEQTERILEQARIRN